MTSADPTRRKVAGWARAWLISDHFDGKRFFNPTLPDGFAPTLRSISRMLREPRSRWPRVVENKGVPQLNATLAVDDIAVTFVGRATFLTQIGGIAILTDPIWSERASPFRWMGPRRVRKPGVAFEDLPKIDLVLISHNHYDHLDLETLKRLRQTFSPAVLCAAGDARLVGPLGFADMRELDWWDETEIGEGLKVTFVPAQHSSAQSARPAAQPVGRLCDQEPRPARLFQRRHRILEALLGYQSAPGISRYRVAHHRRL
jgi:hypothetical protein